MMTDLSRSRIENSGRGAAAREIDARAGVVRAGMVALAGLLSLVAVRGVRAQEYVAQTAAVSAAAARMPVPFSQGEHLTFDVSFGALRVGEAHMEVVGIENIRGREAWHTRFRVKGGVPFYRVNDKLESWIDTRTFHSLRFVQDLEEGGRERQRHFEIFPERGSWIEKGKESQPGVADPLDDGAFLFFVRTLPLEVGKTYEFDRYFRPDRNPVRIKVLRRERISVPAGEFETIVIQPVIKTKGIFSEKGHAEMWLTDDERRMVVQLKSRLSIGSLNLHLSAFTPGAAPSDGAP